MTIMVTWHPLVGGFVNFLFAMFDWAAMQYLIYAHLLGDSIGYGLLFFFTRFTPSNGSLGVATKKK